MVVPTAYCINLDRCTNNWVQMKTSWEGIFNLHRVSAVKSGLFKCNGRTACRMSHISCLKTVSLRAEPYQIVLEDDVYPTEAFKRLWPAILSFLESGRTDWDFIVLDPVVEIEKPTLTVFTPELFTISASRMMGGVIYRTAFLKENIHTISRGNSPLDLTMTRNTQFRKLTPQHLVMRQRADKPSLTSGNRTTAYYDTFYDNTAAYLAAARTKTDHPHDSPAVESTELLSTSSAP
jgi:GR25 family glycosyltransferase involved in LPS biosynthesis